MITRRSAITLLPTALMMGANFKSALAQIAIDPIRPDPSAGQTILSKIQQYQNSSVGPYFEAGAPMIKFSSRLAGRTDLTKTSKSELRDMLNDLKSVNDIANVDQILTMTKKSEAQLGRGLLTLNDKNRLMSDINKQNDQIQATLDKYFGQGGTIDTNGFSKADRDTLKQAADDVLKKGCKLANWGKDSYYAAMRGYCAYAFLTALLKDSLSPPATARAYVLGIMSDSQNYFAVLVSSLSPGSTPPPPSSSSNTNTAAGGPASGGDPIYEYEKRETNRFPKEIYVGSEFGNDTNKCKFDQLANYYGKIDGDFDRGFKLAPGGWTQDCGDLNNKRASAISTQLSDRFRDFVPATGNSENLRVIFDRMLEALNSRVDRIKRQKLQRDKANGAPPPPPPPLSDSDKTDFLPEFQAMERMAWGMREVLSKT
jgi:hypothetical protein